MVADIVGLAFTDYSADRLIRQAVLHQRGGQERQILMLNGILEGNAGGGDNDGLKLQPVGGTETEERRSRRRPNSRGKGGPKPCQAAEKPQTPRQEKPQRPEGGRPQRAERPPARGEKPPRGEKGPVRVDKVEKLPVRAATDTTAEKKAAADRAARQQGGGQEAKPGGGSPHRRPRRRPRGKGEG